MADKDVTGIVVQAQRGASVSGFIGLEDTKDKAGLAQLVKMRLSVSSIGPPGSTLSGQLASIDADGSFSVSGLRPGTLIFSWSLGDSHHDATGFRWGRLEYNGVVQTEKLQVAAADHLTHVRLVFVTGTGRINGVVKCEPEPCPRTMRGSVRLLRAENPLTGAFLDTRGHFLFENLPVGEYKLVVSAEASGFLVTPAAPQQVVVNNNITTDVLASLQFTERGN